MSRPRDASLIVGIFIHRVPPAAGLKRLALVDEEDEGGGGGGGEGGFDDGSTQSAKRGRFSSSSAFPAHAAAPAPSRKVGGDA